MITHRMATQSPGRAARWYKGIALGFLLVTVLLLGVIIFITSKKAEITIVAKNDPKKINVTVQLSRAAAPGSIGGTVTSTVFGWSEQYQPTGTKTVQGTAKGNVILFNTMAVSQPLVKTTRLLTPSGVLFRLAQSTVVPAHGQITVPVYADQAGTASDIGPTSFTIPGLPDAKQKLVYAESRETMAGGSSTVGILSTEDIASAEQNYKEKAKQAFLKTLPSQENTVVTIADQVVKSTGQVGSEVAAFTITGTSTLVIVTYDAAALSKTVGDEVAKKVDLSSEKFIAANAKPSVSVANYSVVNGTAELNVSQDATVTIDTDVDKLAPNNFTGKDVESIKRYILGLDHVVGVDVKLSPGWLSTAPLQPERIRVIVKNVK